MNGLFEDNIFFLYLFACVTIMNYSKMTENQKIILFYLLTFGLAILNIVSIRDCLIYLLLVSFFYLEFLTEDAIKIKFVKKLKYKVLDFVFLMMAQYQLWLFLIALCFTSTKIQKFVEIRTSIAESKINYIMDIGSILLFFVTIFEISKEKFKIKSFQKMLTEDFVPPINESVLGPYEQYSSILTRMEDKTFYTRKGYNCFSFDFVSEKIKQYWNASRNNSFKFRIKEYYQASQIIRGYSTLEMQLLRTVALESGYYMKVSRKIFEILYTTIIFKSMQEYYDKNHYVNGGKFKEYLLTIYISRVRTRIDGVVYSNMTKYLGENLKDWTKEKFYIACLGLPYSQFTDYYVYELYNDLIMELGINIDDIEKELDRVSTLDRDYYGAS